MKYFIADTHFDHWNLVSRFPRRHPTFQRPFDNSDEHDTFLIDVINDTVDRGDELFVLGDFCLKRPGRFRQRIKCRQVRLIRGNHDPVQASINVFGDMPYMQVIKLRGEFDDAPATLSAVLSHAPQAFWFGSHRGWGHAYGHCHGQREDTLTQALGWQRRSIDVGVDYLARLLGTFKPVSEQYLLSTFLSLPGHDQPSFYPNNLHA
jgi:calcineurin-like phosphoesterase family protein